METTVGAKVTAALPLLLLLRAPPPARAVQVTARGDEEQIRGVEEGESKGRSLNVQGQRRVREVGRVRGVGKVIEVEAVVRERRKERVGRGRRRVRVRVARRRKGSVKRVELEGNGGDEREEENFIKYIDMRKIVG